MRRERWQVVIGPYRDTVGQARERPVACAPADAVTVGVDVPFAHLAGRVGLPDQSMPGREQKPRQRYRWSKVGCEATHASDSTARGRSVI